MKFKRSAGFSLVGLTIALGGMALSHLTLALGQNVYLNGEGYNPGAVNTTGIPVSSRYLSSERIILPATSAIETSHLFPAPAARPVAAARTSADGSFEVLAALQRS